jgi:copper(I)-binding protein
MNINYRNVYPSAVAGTLAMFLVALTLQGCGTDNDSAKDSGNDASVSAAHNDHQMDAGDTAIASLHLVEARINKPAPGQRMSAGYFTLMNHGTEAITLTKIASDAADVQMHTTTLEASGTTMRPLSEITIAPNGQIVFRPGGNHLMISNIPADAQSLPITMSFDNGGSMSASFTIIPMDAWMNATQ